MFTLTKRADYGLSLLSILAEKGRGGRVSLKELGEMGMPRAFMAKIVTPLIEAGILNSKEGRGGGFALNYDPKEIQIKEALEAIEGEVEPVSCGGCPAGDCCNQQDFMERLTKDINKLLEKYTLEDLIK
ncbi:MAG: Transcriptional regulator, BadM/Rrf2 family [Candidatus Collierbacteria bacterium GW2011_GWB1_45_35]|uniref:Transcriptional regulator, BadM/Rrf2 family n=2 Tax=Candidatus Collieribacteriota TaxID=1752725 RepID=A0A0G1NPB3_9BACT|nr:MAG: Transcriptional regulator, BadM/Rrf2 family [Microgenomates group bacterium GW2011_GWC1_44_23]KKT86049.1 MAG: Transcriptional regulator, BadM/Rrf2 family [Candidatus Collierbacteria bacterium GW2011_GWA2_44_99]KKT95627.1 MAG: Transcriptional regulator, BadM/Rrf2 family [Candidatus Collierbacteria bacterium GW2011_GWA1_45_15]KKU00473.1 MAG: Transcriptional regulator, BadM/Rrf2 family [Candidatus Collierbacteria bacterium GW2011_GWB2_45_17]KKU05574.1 MAG: Transcriptional regulator, BadM/R